MESPIVTLTHAIKSFVDGKDIHHVLDNVDFALATRASVALTGASGSGKSTLLNIIAGFEPLSGGELWLDGENTLNWKDPQWSRFRHQKLGVIFQQFNLLTPLNVKQNIAFPLHLNQQKWSDWCDYLVDALGISELLERHVSALSGGQQQRVAIARALAHKPKLLLADEPTGNLDHKAGIEVMKLLSEITTQGNTAVLLVTHSPECASFMQTKLVLDDGCLKNADRTQAKEQQLCE
ncbi:putative ABC-type dipeptide/oligopeptide/nickel transport system, ATPase component [Vibrio crassostreae]|uniref:ABC-type dipeptide/oligopeptide/nickel transport system, ATPase component n=1 Tax=Vibrio crassostreae TaxID=246167 RepID=A0A4R2EJ94_9VIBR|nr:ABC transporter ATP-binding protein [Vibrio crassostreae]MDH5950186.1 ABC transporter ATP-binding protein [Vibrio crassostreae]ROO55507.1 putative ABC transport system ATP-binding protein [Vibrio crassostreae]ROO65939.1 putative ABC transport system ATP-binding protein [Vibrio crassostreae]ROO71775.1 putative ABC transport system ATP-binding protein [Vibrio crassostreae]ROO73334.1 putative ABC transport system ATP-binding protein [Vibrio crassostreae]